MIAIDLKELVVNDGPLKHDRDFSALRDRYGIKDPDWAEAVEFERQVRMGVVLDDTSHLVRPIGVPVGIYLVVQPGVAGVYSGCQIQVVARNGAYLNAMTTSGNVVCHQQTLLAFTSVAVVPPNVIAADQGAPESIVERGTTPTLPSGPYLASFHGQTPWLPLWFPPGTLIQFWERGAVNTAAIISLQIQEVP